MAEERTNQKKLDDTIYLLDSPASHLFGRIAAAVLNQRVPLFDPVTGKDTGKTASLGSMVGWMNAPSHVASREGEATRKELAGLRAAVTALATEKGIKLEDIKALLEENRQKASVDLPETLTYKLQDVAASDVKVPEAKK